MKHITALLVFSVALSSCFLKQISGAHEPTEHQFHLTDGDIAAAESTECMQTWVTGDADTDLASAHVRLKEYGVKIKEGNPTGFTTALRKTLWAKEGFSKKPTEEQVYTLSHELVHYCQRSLMGDNAFDKASANSAGRFRLETPAYLQSFRTYKVYCASSKTIENRIVDRQKAFRDKYWLWDIDSDQYLQTTGRIWRTALNFDANCK